MAKMVSIDDKVMDEDMAPPKSEWEETIELLKSMEEKSNNCHKLVSNVLSRLKDNELSTQNGNSFVELKNRVFLSYLMDLTYLVLRKVNGQQLDGSDVVRRLVEHRTVLERMRPIEHKLKYTFDKLIKTSTDGTIDPNDPLRFKPKLNTIVGSNDNEDNQMDDNNDQMGDVEGEEGVDPSGDVVKRAMGGVYVPPRVAQMRYDMEEEERKTKALERAKKKAMNSSIIADLRQEFDGRPEEVSHSSMANNKLNRFMKEKTAYEEQYMTRMNLTRKQRNDTKRLQSMTAVTAGLTHFEDITALDIEDTDDFNDQFSKQKKRGSASSKTKKSKSFKKSKKKFKK